MKNIVDAIANYLQLQELYSDSRLGAIRFDLTSIPLSFKATVYTQVF